MTQLTIDKANTTDEEVWIDIAGVGVIVVQLGNNELALTGLPIQHMDEEERGVVFETYIPFDNFFDIPDALTKFTYPRNLPNFRARLKAPDGDGWEKWGFTFPTFYGNDIANQKAWYRWREIEHLMEIGFEVWYEKSRRIVWYRELKKEAE
jgi:hypothetical protein